LLSVEQASIELIFGDFPLIIFKPGESTALCLLLIGARIKVDGVAFELFLLMLFQFKLGLDYHSGNTVSLRRVIQALIVAA